MPTVSVIVPIYNAEKVLNQCIESILCQTYKDFELILVDDGSADKSPWICDNYVQVHSCVKVIHKENQGVSSARNAGLLEATGTYITFIDADDYVSKDYLSVLIEGAKNAFDFVCAAKTNVYSDRLVLDKKPAFELDLTHEIGPAYYNKLAGYTAPWMKLFKREIIMGNNIRFNPAIAYGEDTAFVYEYLCHCKRIKQLSDCVYFYRIYDGSAAHKFQKGISGCLAYRQTYFEAFIRKLQFVDPVNDIIIEGFAYNGFRLLTYNVLRGSLEDAIQEIACGRTKFMPYIDRLYQRICNNEDVSCGGIPNTFYKEIEFFAKAKSAKRIYFYIACNSRKTRIVSKVKAYIKKIIK